MTTVLVVFVLALIGSHSPALAQSEASAQVVCDAYWNQEYDRALELATKTLAEASDPGEQVEAYKCQACTYIALRRLPPAKTSIAGMLNVNPAARFSPEYDYPPPVIELYHLVHDSVFAGDQATMDIRTVAVGDFEDNSIFTGTSKDYDFSLFQRALVHIITADLAEATDLQIVDRQRTRQLLEEVELGQSGFVDPTQAVAPGKFLGAHTFIFGQYMILSEKKMLIEARVVHTATGRVILTKRVTGEFSGDPEKFLKLEAELVTAIAGAIDEILASGEAETGVQKRVSSYLSDKAESVRGREDYLKSMLLTADALDLEEKGRYSAAMAKWENVRKLDPDNEVADLRLSILSAMASN